MMPYQKIFFAFSWMLLISSCSNEMEKPSSENAALIESQHFVVEGGKDTVLTTQNGNLIIISEASFPANRPINIELKEISSSAEMLIAGLTTLSNGQLLQSDGMFYIEASSEGKPLEFSAPIKMQIAKSSRQAKFDEMEFFQGEQLQSGELNWVNPLPIQSRSLSECEIVGRDLFIAACMSCHGLETEGTGPPLRGVRQKDRWRNAGKELYAFVRDPSSFIGTDPYMREQKEQYGSVMTSFPLLSDAELHCLFDYLDSVSPTEYRRDVETFQRIRRTKILRTDSSSMLGNEMDQIDYSWYEVTIRFNGWYNIDKFIDETELPLSRVELVATIADADVFPMSINLLIPSEKIAIPLYRTDSGHYEAFKELELPLGYRAIILATSQNGNIIKYGINVFQIDRNNRIELQLKETTVERFKNLMYNYRIEDVEIF